MTPSARSYCYQIILEGHLEERWLRIFEGLVIEQRPEGETVLQGRMDQSTLHGLLNTILDLGMALLSIQRLKTADENHPNDIQTYNNSKTQEPSQ